MYRTYYLILGSSIFQTLIGYFLFCFLVVLTTRLNIIIKIHDTFFSYRIRDKSTTSDVHRHIPIPLLCNGRQHSCVAYGRKNG